MTKLGDITKGVLIVFCIYFLIAAIGQALNGQTAIAAFMFAGFLVPLSIVIYGYAKDKKERKASTLNH
ncbi:MAG: hypothetical protein ACQCN3_12245 [Candidatus Bathyarchaeia archaeon]|jgi:predicted Co/Zn/Cd cation transporter (cation efflux family)